MKLTGKPLKYHDIYQSVRLHKSIEVETSLLQALTHKRTKLEELIKKKQVMYGITTGFGGLKDTSISPEDTLKLQENIIKSHAVGVGKPLSSSIVKIIMILMVNYLIKGYSGVRPIVVETLLKLINSDIIPVVPEKGSVGSSGDLAPSAHIVLVLIGKGQAFVKGKLIGGKEAFKQKRITPLVLQAKEGLALLNNTATMTAQAVCATSEALYIADLADTIAALSIEALQATPTAFDSRIHDLKPYRNQQLVAKRLRDLLGGSTMVDKKRIQDQYSIRCIPQVHGAIREVIDFVEKTINTEINSVTDNPLLFSSSRGIDVLSGGNFHGEAVGLAMDSLKMALAEFANISDRRIASLLDPHHNFGLPAFLIDNPGLNSGFMIAQYTTASLASENKILSHPSTVDSIPTSANIEDFVSMGTTAARLTLEVLENVRTVLAIELLIACQAIDFRLREGYRLGQGTEKLYKKTRKHVPFLKKDQEYYQYIGTVNSLLKEQTL